MGPIKVGLIIKMGPNVDPLQRKVDLLRKSSTLALFELDHVVSGAKKRGTTYKKGTKCGPFPEKNRPTQEVQHLTSSFWAGPRRIWDQKLIFYGPLYSRPLSEGRFRGWPFMNSISL